MSKQSIAMFSSGAVLGPMCDGMHSLNGVLAYKEPFAVPLLNFQTCWWVPCLFGVAGCIIGLGVPLLDSVLDEEAKVPEWPKVLLCISSFVVCYYLSAKLDAPLETYPGAEDLILWIYAVACWAVFDRSRSGVAMSALTAVAGPLIEILLIGFGLYSYSHPSQGLDIPTWIAPVYFCGGPAVGMLGRRVKRSLQSRGTRV
jgi:hypothetical protein